MLNKIVFFFVKKKKEKKNITVQKKKIGKLNQIIISDINCAMVIDHQIKYLLQCINNVSFPYHFRIHQFSKKIIKK